MGNYPWVRIPLSPPQTDKEGAKMKYKYKPLKRKFITACHIEKPNELHAVAFNIKTNEEQKEIVVFGDPNVMDIAKYVMFSCLEEYEYGLYRDDCTLKNIVDGAIVAAREQYELTKDMVVLKNKNKKTIAKENTNV
jgi:hypothetical protein